MTSNLRELKNVIDLADLTVTAIYRPMPSAGPV